MIATTEMRDEQSSLVQMCAVFAVLAGIVFGVERVATTGTFRTDSLFVDNKVQLGQTPPSASQRAFFEDTSTTNTTMWWTQSDSVGHVGTGGNNEVIHWVDRLNDTFDTTANAGNSTIHDDIISCGISAGANPLTCAVLRPNASCSTGNCTAYSYLSSIGIFRNDGPVDVSASPTVQLGSSVQNFRVNPTNPVVTADIDIGCTPPVDGFNLHMKNNAAGVGLAGSIIGLDTTVNPGIRGGYLIARGAGGGFSGNNGGLAVSSGNGFPFGTSLANELNLFAEQGPIVFGADAIGFTSATRLSTSNHWTQDLSTGLPGLGAGCTSGGGSLIVGNDNRFMVTMGAASSACTITYSKTHTTTPMCIITPYGTATLPVCTPSATQMVCSTNAASTTYVFDCQSQPGGT